MTELPPGLASLRHFAAAANSQDGTVLRAIQENFEKCGQKIENSYVTQGINACALLVVEEQRPRRWQRSARRRRQVMVWLDRRDLVMREPRFTHALWRTLWLARRAENTSGAMISEHCRKLVGDMLFTAAVFLLGALDVAAKMAGDAKKLAGNAGSSTESILAPLRRAAAIAEDELNHIEEYLERAAIRKTFSRYLLGLPFGAALLALPIFVVVRLLPLANQPTLLISICIIGGGLGAITSVMVRITRGQKLEVDIHQGRAVTFIAGMFRPLVGATFGVALYVLVIGGLLPLAPNSQAAAHFFGGLSFLAGFSERWAQDTIVRSAPIAPSPATTVKTGRETAQSDDAWRIESRGSDGRGLIGGQNGNDANDLASRVSTHDAGSSG